jgi:hypothetical protein
MEASSFHLLLNRLLWKFKCLWFQFRRILFLEIFWTSKEGRKNKEGFEEGKDWKEGRFVKRKLNSHKKLQQKLVLLFAIELKIHLLFDSELKQVLVSFFIISMYTIFHSSFKHCYQIVTVLRQQVRRFKTCNQWLWVLHSMTPFFNNLSFALPFKSFFLFLPQIRITKPLSKQKFNCNKLCANSYVVFYFLLISPAVTSFPECSFISW